MSGPSSVNDSTPARPPSPQGWWSPQIERKELLQLLRKRDLPGLAFFGAWLLALAGTTLLIWAAWATWWVVPAVVLHGAVLSFAYAASHEGAHGTAFDIRWLNEAIFYLTSFIFGEEPMWRRYSHARHHSATWYLGFDSQMPYRNPVTLGHYIKETTGLLSLIESFKQLCRFAAGRLLDSERSVIPEARVRQVVWGSRAFLLGYASVAAIAVVTHSWFIVVAFPGARLAGGWIVNLFINSQHMCMAESIPDHRYCTRSLACSLPTRVLYWNMNFHIEHHLYPGVPFHSLPSVNAAIHQQLPRPLRGAWAANREILEVITQQRTNSGCIARPKFVA